MSTLAADRWLTARLSPLAPVFADVAPPDAAAPFLVFSLADARDVAVVGDVRLIVDATYLVKAVGEGRSYAAIEPLALALDAALHGQRDETAGGAVVRCSRTRPIRYAEHSAGVDYRHLGGYYRVQIKG